jgi:O-antigen/teichoic acid export membrane protein
MRAGRPRTRGINSAFMAAADRTAPPAWLGYIRKLRTEAGRQTSILYGAQIASSALSLAFTSTLARALHREGFGVFSFCWFSIISYVGLLFEFGVFSAGARLLAVSGDSEGERRMLGALVTAAAVIGLLFGVTIAASGPLVDWIFDTSVAPILLAAAPFVVAVPLQMMLDFACQGMNRIGTLAVLRLTLPTVGLAIVGVLFALPGGASPLRAVVAYAGGLLVATVVVVALLRPSFENLRDELRRLLAATREYGLNIFFGRATSMLSTRFDSVLIPYYIGLPAVGVYNLARQISDPVQTLARSLAMTRFKAFAARDEVSAYIQKMNAALLLVAVLGLVTVGPLAVYLFFGKRYADAAVLIGPLGLAALFAGLFQPYNTFLTAHGRGRELRNISLAMCVVNTAGLLAFVPAFGVAGAAWWAAGSMAFSFLLHLYYYRQVRNMLRKVTE